MGSMEDNTPHLMTRPSVAVLLLVASGAGGCAPRPRSGAAPLPSPDRPRPALADLPLLKQPRITVESTALVQEGRHLEMAALVTNADPQLDGRKVTVTLVAMDPGGQVVTQATVQLAGISAATTVAASAALDLGSDRPVSEVRAFVGFGDAGIRRAEGATRLEASQVEVRVDAGGALSVTGRLPQRQAYPGRYRVDAVLLDRDRVIVASARSTECTVLGPDAKTEWATFTARGRARPGLDVSGLRPVVTITPAGDGS
jgi:hypothetical protein